MLPAARQEQRHSKHSIMDNIDIHVSINKLTKIVYFEPLLIQNITKIRQARYIVEETVTLVAADLKGIAYGA